MFSIIVALLVTQIFWFQKAFTLHENQYEEKLNIALRKVANDLLILDNDTTKRIPPIAKIATNEYLVKTECYFTLAVLDHHIRKEFRLRKIEVDFDYIIINAKSKTVELGNSVQDLSDTNNIACQERIYPEISNEIYNFKIRINNQTTYLVNTMGIWIYSSLTLLLMLAVFIFITIAMLRSRKLAILKKDFVNNMTHELKTPIANIALASDAIRNPAIQMDEKKLQKYADIVHAENNRLHLLVDKVLQISSIEKQSDSLTMEPVDLHQIILQVAQSFEPLLKNKGGILDLHLGAKDHIMGGDKMHLTNVINNLVDNAIKYSKDEIEIDIASTSRAGKLILTVRDQGIGIEQEKRIKIFEQFYRGESGNIQNTKGHGLGLSYAKLIIEKHNGSISVMSKKNEGTIFTITLPIA